MSVENTIVIDAEFQSLIPAMDVAELSRLEENILRDGIRDPLVLWDGILLDGHNRHAIAMRHNLPFDVVEIELADREAALDWIDRNQLGRRNLTPENLAMIRGRVYNRAKKNRVKNLNRGNTPNEQNYRSGETAENIGKEMGVTGKTIRQDGKFAEAVDKIGAASPEAKATILAGEPAKPTGNGKLAKATKAEVIAAGDARCAKCARIFKNALEKSVPGCVQCAEMALAALGKRRKVKANGDGVCPHCNGTGMA